MPIVTARRLCPQAVYLPVRMRHYALVSRQIQDIFLDFTPCVEPLSLDEAFLDVHGCESLLGPAPGIAQRIKARVKAETGLTASVGVAPNKFLAKLASDYGKPDGLVVLSSERVADFLQTASHRATLGVGAKAERKLQDAGIHTVGQLAALPEKIVVDRLQAPGGQHLWLLAHGRDGRQVVPTAKPSRSAPRRRSNTTSAIPNCFAPGWST